MDTSSEHTWSVDTSQVGGVPFVPTWDTPSHLAQGGTEPNEGSGIRSKRSWGAAPLRPYLAGGMPGLWANNHLEEVQHLVGWQYAIIHSMSKQAAAAEVTCYRVGYPRKRRHDEVRRKSQEVGSSGSDAHKPQRRPLSERHPLVRLIRRPNPEQSGASFRYHVAQQLAMTGSALIWTVRNGLGVPLERYVIPTAAAISRPPSHGYPKGSYRVSPLASWITPMEDGFQPPGSLGPLLASGALIDGRDVKPIRWPHPIYRTDGLSTLAAGALWIDLAEQMDRSRWYQMKNLSRPGLVFEQDSEDALNVNEAEAKAFREDLRNRNQGVTNEGKDLILPPGIKPHQMAPNPKDTDWQNGFVQMRDASLAIHGAPAVAVGVGDAGSYSANHAALKLFSELTMQPMLCLIAEEDTEDLAPDFARATELRDGDYYEIEYKAKAFDDPDLALRERSQDNQEHSTLLQAQVATKNEFRKMVGMPPTEEAWGDDIAGSPSQGEEEQGGAGGLAGLMGGAGGAAQEGEEIQEGQEQTDDGDDPFAFLFADDDTSDEDDDTTPTPTDTGVRDSQRDKVPGRPKMKHTSNGNGHNRLKHILPQSNGSTAPPPGAVESKGKGSTAPPQGAVENGKKVRPRGKSPGSVTLITELPT